MTPETISDASFEHGLELEQEIEKLQAENELLKNTPVKTTCYECGKDVLEINKNSRCIDCVTRRNDFNVKENAKLRQIIGARNQTIIEMSQQLNKEQAENAKLQVHYQENVVGLEKRISVLIERRNKAMKCLESESDDCAYDALCSLQGRD